MDIIDIDEISDLRKQHEIKNSITKYNESITTNVDKVIKATEKHFKNSSIEKSINWITYMNTWFKNEDEKLKENFYNYERGDVILALDLGTTNIGTEIRYPHPCVVLFDGNEDWLIVAPITSAALDRFTGRPIVYEFDIYVDEQKYKPKNNREFHFRKKSVIQIDQIHRVSKHRVINKDKLKIRIDLLEKIDNIMLEKYLPRKKSLMEKLKYTNKDLLIKIGRVIETNKRLAGEVKRKNQKIKELTEKIKKLEKNNKN